MELGRAAVRCPRGARKRPRGTVGRGSTTGPGTRKRGISG